MAPPLTLSIILSQTTTVCSSDILASLTPDLAEDPASYTGLPWDVARWRCLTTRPATPDCREIVPAPGPVNAASSTSTVSSSLVSSS
jgi:hypothetical protein